jgi:hypothetical protein
MIVDSQHLNTSNVLENGDIGFPAREIEVDI